MKRNLWKVVIGLLAGIGIVVLNMTVLPVERGVSYVPVESQPKALPILGHVPKDDLTVQISGGEEHGSMSDNYYGGPDHNLFVSWDMGVRAEIGSGNAEWSSTRFTIQTNALPETSDGHLKCAQIAVDWRIPPFESHYDMRRLVNCDDFSTAIWTFNERDTDNSTDGGPEDCVGAREVPCISPMGRVQMAMYIPHLIGDSSIVGPIQCRVFPGGVALSDCKTWHPWGQLSSSRTKIRFSDGSTGFSGSLNATDADQKVKY